MEQFWTRGSLEQRVMKAHYWTDANEINEEDDACVGVLNPTYATHVPPFLLSVPRALVEYPNKRVFVARIVAVATANPSMNFTSENARQHPGN